MLTKIYTAAEAQAGILQRKPLHKTSYAPSILRRTEELFGKGITPPTAVSQIIDSVEEGGDQALHHWSELLDRYSEQDLIIQSKFLEQAYKDLPRDLKDTLDCSAERIRQFHERQPVTSWMTDEMGGQLGQRFTSIERIGVYVPGGTAPLPSSLLMSVIPAQVAGVKQIVACTPPKPHPTILAAAHICELDALYQVGGAQAIAAMAFGTESVPKVDKIVGAGNLFVTLAKQQLFGTVGLDGLAGPTETMVIADENADPRWVAADMLAQAEHDVQASAILLTPSQELAQKVQEELEQQTMELPRKEIISASMANRGGIVIIDSLEQAAPVSYTHLTLPTN